MQRNVDKALLNLDDVAQREYEPQRIVAERSEPIPACYALQTAAGVRLAAVAYIPLAPALLRCPWATVTSGELGVFRF